MKIALNELHPDPANARHVPPTEDAIRKMADSMNTVGQLQPIIVRRPEDKKAKGWLVTIGMTRFLAASALAWKDIEANEINGVDPDAASAAENMVRSAMHPVDCWQALAKLRARMSVEDAAPRLGLTVRYAYQLDQLSRMAQPVLDEIAKLDELPSERELRLIAAAPHERQVTALKRNSHRGEVDWYSVANACRVDRIPRERAIFDIVVAQNVCPFEQDFFAEAGAADEWTTTHVDTFMTLQRQALEERVSASKGRMILCETSTTANHTMKEPAGYKLSWETVPKRFRKDDPRKIAVAVTTDGFNLGAIMERVAMPKVTAVASQSARQDDDEQPIAETTRGPITKATLAKLADIQGTAVRQALPSWIDRVLETQDYTSVIAALLHLLGAANVAIRDGAQLYARSGYAHIARGLVDDEGKPARLTDPALLGLVAQALENAVIFAHPNSVVDSGNAAHWIAQIVGADDHCPRCDAADVLGGYSLAALQDIARAHDIDTSGTRKALLGRMVGKLPDWKPVTFGAVPGHADTSGFLDEDETENEAA